MLSPVHFRGNSRIRTFFSRSLESGLLQLPRPSGEALDELADAFPRVFIGEVALFIKALGRVGNHHLGPVKRVHVEEYEALAEMVLGATGAQHSRGGTHYSDWFAVPCIIAVGA